MYSVHVPVLNHVFATGLISPGSASSTEAPGISSPPQNYMDMASPSDRIPATMAGSQSERGYMVMDRGSSQPQGNSASENYMSMGLLVSPGSFFPAWPHHSSSQVRNAALILFPFRNVVQEFYVYIPYFLYWVTVIMQK